MPTSIDDPRREATDMYSLSALGIRAFNAIVARWARHPMQQDEPQGGVWCAGYWWTENDRRSGPGS